MNGKVKWKSFPARERVVVSWEDKVEVVGAVFLSAMFIDTINRWSDIYATYTYITKTNEDVCDL